MQSQNSKSEFFTLDSKLTIQRGKIYSKKLKDNDDAWTNRAIVFLVLVCIIIYSVYEMVEEENYFRLVRVFLFTILLSSFFKRIYQTLFVKTWKSIIPLKDVKNITTKPLDNGLETEVTIHLGNGRKKFYTFRNAEGQMEAFIAAAAEQASLLTPQAIDHQKGFETF